MVYYGYYIDDFNRQERHLMDIEPLIRHFVENASLPVRKSFIYNDENLFLFHEYNNIYLLVLTKNHEVIKMIDENRLSCSDIYNQLQANQGIGFASYIYISPHNYLGYINTLLAPRITAFTYMINRILEIALHHQNYKFGVTPLLQRISRDELRNMEFIGTSHIEVTRDSSFGGELRSLFFGQDNVEYLDSFKVTIKAKKGQNLRDVYGHLLDNLPEEGLEKFNVRAKREIGDLLTEYCVTGSKNVYDNIDKVSGETLYNEIRSRIERNGELNEKIRELQRDGDYEKTPIESVNNIASPLFWSNFTLDL